MRTSPRKNPIVGASLLCILARSATAQPVEVIDEGPAQKELAVARALPDGISAETFDRYVFGKENSSTLLEKLETWLSNRLGEIDKECQLSPAQLQKLKLAGRMEINQLVEQVARRRREFELVRHDLVKANQFLQRLEPLQFAVASSQSAFDLHSFLDKVARTTLMSEQLQRYEHQVEQRLAARRLTLQIKFVQLLEKKSKTSLSDAQRRRLMTLLDKFPLKPPGPKDFGLLWDFASEIPLEKYRDFLDDRQLDSLESLFKLRKQLMIQQNQAMNVGEVR